MKKVVFVSFILLICFGFSIHAQSENDFTVQQNRSGKITITGYTGTVRDVTIPSRISGIDVTEIGGGAFNGRKPNAVKLTSVAIPNTVIIIGPSAFSDNEISRVVFGTGVAEIGMWAFANNRLVTVTVGNNVRTIKEGAFDSNQLTEIILPNSVITLEANTFDHNPIQTISMGTGIKNLGMYAFGAHINSANITSITIVGSVNINNLSGLDTGFVNFYTSQNKRGGTYIKNGQIWTRR